MQAPTDRQICTELRALVDGTDASEDAKEEMHALIGTLQGRLHGAAGASLPPSYAVAQVGRQPALGAQVVSKMRFQAAPLQPSISTENMMKLLALRLKNPKFLGLDAIPELTHRNCWMESQSTPSTSSRARAPMRR